MKFKNISFQWACSAPHTDYLFANRLTVTSFFFSFKLTNNLNLQIYLLSMLQLKKKKKRSAFYTHLLSSSKEDMGFQYMILNKISLHLLLIYVCKEYLFQFVLYLFIRWKITISYKYTLSFSLKCIFFLICILKIKQYYY